MRKSKAEGGRKHNGGRQGFNFKFEDIRHPMILLENQYLYS